MEDLSREVSHVAVEENEQGLDDPRVRGEARREGPQDAIDGSHHDASQWDHKETDHTEDGVHHSHSSCVGELLEQVIQNLHRETCFLSLSLAFLCFIQGNLDQDADRFRDFTLTYT